MFKSISIAIIAAAVALGAAAVDAKKLGGGKAVGAQRSAPAATPAASPTSAMPATAAAAAPAAAAAAVPKTGMAKWAGPLAGIAAGLGLGYLFSQLGGGAASMIMMMLLGVLVIGVVFFAIRMFMRRNQPATANGAPMPFGSAPQAEPMQYAGAGAAMGGAAGAAPVVSGNFGIPADFDKAGFENNAKSQFMALQAANDKGDLDAVRNFATDEFYNEIAKRRDQRQQGRNRC